MGLKLVDVNDDIARALPECNAGSQILQVLESADLIRSQGLWGPLPRQGLRFVVRSLADTPLLIATKDEPAIGTAAASPGERLAWGEYKKSDEPFTPGEVIIEPMQFIAGSLTRLALGSKAVEIQVSDRDEMFIEDDVPSSCRFEAGNPPVQFGLVPLEWLSNVRPISFS